MSRDGKVTFVWGDGPHVFRLAVGELEELQEKCGDVGPELILRRIVTAEWRIAYLRETIRIGLIGGGMKPADAYKLVQRYASEPPFAHLQDAARVILHTALYGAPDGEKPGKRKAARGEIEQPNSPTEGSPSPPSTGPVLQ